MGFKVKNTIFRLTFDDPEYEGLEIEVKKADFGTFLDLSGLAGLDPTEATGEDVAEVTKLFQTFADHLMGWNLEDDDDQPIPKTVAGLKTLPIDFVMLIVGAWMDAMKGVTPDLPQPSSGGPPSLEGSIPMDDWSQSLRPLQEHG